MHVQKQVTAPHAISLGDPTLTTGNAAEPVWRRWREQLAAIGGTSPLLHFHDVPRSRIELSTTHPGGLAQFITGKTTMLSSLIRDELALRQAKLAAGAIASKGVELSTARGLDAVHLAIGIVEWSHDGTEYRAPILLRPLGIRRHGRDFELKLRGTARLNPELARALSSQFGIVLDADAFVALTTQEGSFKPNAVIDRLRGLTGHLDDIRVFPRLVVSSFVDVAGAMRADAADLAHPVLDALAGNASAKWEVEEGYRPVEPAHPDHREPTTDILLLDADAEQENVIAQIAAGNSVVVKTLPGTGGTQTIVNALGTLVAQNKRVLVVSPRRATLDGIAQRFADIGLAGLAVAPGTLRRDVIRSISRAEKAAKPQLAEVDDALVRLRRVLLDYRGALTKADPALGVSVLDCVTELSRLALLPTPPATTARLSREAIERLADDRHDAAEAMVAAARLGEFKYGPGDSAWYGAVFATGEEAGHAHSLAQRLADEALPRLLVRANHLIEGTALRPFTTIAELGIYLRLLTDLRETLDRFQPMVFDRSLSELISATASRRDAPEMSTGNRRRLKKLAREYVRPGVHVSDLHGALTRIQQQRILWQRYATAGAVPEVPVGIADVQVAYQQVAQDLASLDGPLGRTGRENALGQLPLDDLTRLVGALAEPSDVLHNLQERTQLMTRLRGLQLDPLIADLAVRHVPEDQVEAELELAWWTSSLESLLEQERALLGADTSVLDRLEADFRLVDEAHVAGSAGLLGWQLAENWKIGLVDWPDEADGLKKLLRHPSVTAYELQTTAPHLSRAIAPVWISSPYEVHTITDTMPFDAVVLVDAGATTLAENVGAIRRGKQIVAFGDPVTQTPAAFETAIPVAERDDRPTNSAHREGEDIEQLHADSALARLGSLLPTLSLTRSYRAGGEDLAELVNRRFYGGRIESFPWAGSFLGHGSLAIEHIREGSGLPDEETGAVESVDAEVARVVELVLDHAAKRPRESLMVITASAKHAVRVQQAVLNAVAGRADLTEFVVADRAEPFTVLTVEQAVAESRDRVIFSIGFGRTPHGRVLSNFGALGEPGGERLLAVAMTRARRALTVVSCFVADDLDEDRMQHGAVALAQILREVSARDAIEHLPDDSDPMLVDLARRLEARGVHSVLGHRGKLGLVAAHGGVCVTVDTDAALLGSSLRESLRLRPEILRRLGWHYVRVHAFELFSEPDAVADRICVLLGVPTGPVTEEIPVIRTADA
ncbi:DUF4011 domain-containing protein [Diaminobutyricimonas aerilata]|nr:DUF4011 domain-containing protein [Diaminobutyricimonas aerilata]